MSKSLPLILRHGDIAASTPDPEFHRIPVEHGMRRMPRCAETWGEEELRELRAREAGLEGFSGQSL